jgi:hypothetical protein
MIRVKSGLYHDAAASTKSNLNRLTLLPNRQLARLHSHFDELRHFRFAQSLLPGEQL